jgi:hypothetical protein
MGRSCRMVGRGSGVCIVGVSALLTRGWVDGVFFGVGIGSTLLFNGPHFCLDSFLFVIISE